MVPHRMDFPSFLAFSSSGIAGTASRSSKSVGRRSKIPMAVQFFRGSQFVLDQNQHTGGPVQVQVK